MHYIKAPQSEESVTLLKSQYQIQILYQSMLCTTHLPRQLSKLQPLDKEMQKKHLLHERGGAPEREI
ncbi:hypothetical protein SDC9_135981 [bioreactor metagenome]|uniref:Uncharacterized protein n=1 Tax=bioreactor metagenome TaxID=1076179 RepID=A0A645DHY7_9ZZZZ